MFTLQTTNLIDFTYKKHNIEHIFDTLRMFYEKKDILKFLTYIGDNFSKEKIIKFLKDHNTIVMLNKIEKTGKSPNIYNLWSNWYALNNK